MRRIAILGAIFLGMSGAAQAHTFSAGHALLRASAQVAKTADVAQPRCPAEVPVQMITVINQAHASQFALAKVERAVVDQSMQLRAAWGTPCVQFAAGGWPVYLQAGYSPDPAGGYTLRIGGVHYGIGAPGPDWQATPYAIVETGAETYEAWAPSFSHEVAEMLVDPDADTYHVWPTGVRELLEVCDPVENDTYTLDGVKVDDFTFPVAWSGGSGPYDELGKLIAPLAPGYTLGLS